jgi:X-Pro dipeptidyl-peptidase
VRAPARTFVAVLAVAAMAAAPSSCGGSAGAGAAEPQTAVGITQPVYPGQTVEPYVVETEHGDIYGEVVRPVDADGEVVTDTPVILTYSPYNVIRSATNHTGSIATDAVARYFVPRGYARAAFDVVGTRESSGCYDYGGIRERETGADVVDHLGSRDWSNGRVAMIGGSYDGTTAIAAAVEQPEHLAAIVPQVAIDRWYDYAYGGGIRYFLNSEDPSDEGFDTPLAFDFGFGFLPPTDPSQPHFSDALEDRFVPCEGLLHTERAYDPDPVYDAFWDERDYRADADQVRAAVLVEGGWLDHNVKHWGSTRFFQALPDGVAKHLVMGQWAHSASRFEDAQDLRHAWFDRYLLGLDTGVEELPAVDTQTNDGVRNQHGSWPPEGTRDVSLALTTAALDDVPSRLQLRSGPSATWTDVAKTLTEEEAFATDCGLQACALFTTGPIPGGIRVSGSPTLAATLVTDATETHLTPVLFDEAPDGSREVITRGFLNVRNHDSLRTSEPVVPGEPFDVEVEFWDVDWRLPDGHRLGVTLASSNAAWVLPDTTVATTSADLSASQLSVPVSEGAKALRERPGAGMPARGRSGR